MPLFNQSASVSLPFCRCVCLTFVVFTDCESRTMPIFTNLGSMEACEYGLTRGTCFVARCLEVVAVAGLLWISRCVLSAAGFFRVLIFDFFFFERARPAASMRTPCLIYLSTSTGVRTGCHYLINNHPSVVLTADVFQFLVQKQSVGPSAYV